MVNLSKLEYLPKFIIAKQFTKLFGNDKLIEHVYVEYNGVIYNGIIVDRYKDKYNDLFIIEWTTD